MPRDLLTFVTTGVRELDQALSDINDKVVMRQVVRGPAMAALVPVNAQVKQNSRRTHPLSMQRNPGTNKLMQASARAGRVLNNRIGPLARYVKVRPISARSQSIGARVSYDTKVFPGFVVYGKSTKKRAFYPSSQEYGAKGAKPAIKPKRQMARAAEAKKGAAMGIFRQKFKTSYEGRTAKLMKRRGLTVTVS